MFGKEFPSPAHRAMAAGMVGFTLAGFIAPAGPYCLWPDRDTCQVEQPTMADEPTPQLPFGSIDQNRSITTLPSSTGTLATGGSTLSGIGFRTL